MSLSRSGEHAGDSGCTIASACLEERFEELSQDLEADYDGLSFEFPCPLRGPAQARQSQELRCQGRRHGRPPRRESRSRPSSHRKHASASTKRPPGSEPRDQRSDRARSTRRAPTEHGHAGPSGAGIEHGAGYPAGAIVENVVPGGVLSSFVIVPKSLAIGTDLQRGVVQAELVGGPDAAALRLLRWALWRCGGRRVARPERRGNPPIPGAATQPLTAGPRRLASDGECRNATSLKRPRCVS